MELLKLNKSFYIMGENKYSFINHFLKFNKLNINKVYLFCDRIDPYLFTHESTEIIDINSREIFFSNIINKTILSFKNLLNNTYIIENDLYNYKNILIINCNIIEKSFDSIIKHLCKYSKYYNFTLLILDNEYHKPLYNTEYVIFGKYTSNVNNLFESYQVFNNNIINILKNKKKVLVVHNKKNQNNNYFLINIFPDNKKYNKLLKNLTVKI